MRCPTVPIFVAFLVIMAVVGWATARVTRLDVPDARALIFSGATRNSLVVLPLALAHSDRIIGLRHGRMLVAGATSQLDAAALSPLYDDEEHDDDAHH